MDVREELWQAYNEQGEPTTAVTKSVGRTGVLHGASHIWIYRSINDGIEILLQKRATNKPTWPDYLDISAAGHIDYGETPLAAALRETQEEIGLTITDKDLKLLFVRRVCMNAPSTEIIENEFQWVYSYHLPTDVALSYHDSEVQATIWLTLVECKKLIADGTSGDKIVPHGDSYFLSLFQGIEQHSSR